MAEMTKTKELLAWQYAIKAIDGYTAKNPMTRMRHMVTMETANGSDAIALITKQIERLTGQTEETGIWLDTATDKPADPHETIIVQDDHGNVYTAPGWIVRDFPGTHPRWMHLPKVSGSEPRKAPEAEG